MFGDFKLIKFDKSGLKLGLGLLTPELCLTPRTIIRIFSGHTTRLHLVIEMFESKRLTGARVKISEESKRRTSTRNVYKEYLQRISRKAATSC